MAIGAKPFSTATRHGAVRKRSQAKLATQVSAAAGSSMASAATSAPGHPAAFMPIRAAMRAVLGPGAACAMAKMSANSPSVSHL